MAIVRLYNHSTFQIQSGGFVAADNYLITLYSSLPFNATATTKTAAESGGTQIATANGYTQNAKLLTGVSIAQVTTNDSRFTFDPVEWTASGGSIAAAFALISNDTDTNDPPFAHIDFEGTITAPAGLPFRITPDANGFVLLQYTLPS